MNLREEILEIIDSGVSCDDDYPYYIGDPIDEIIKVIEKRIDDKDKNTGSTNGLDVPNSFFVMGYRQALTEVKELLK